MIWPKPEAPDAPLREDEIDDAIKVLSHLRLWLVAGVDKAYANHPLLAGEKRKSIQTCVATLIRHVNETRGRL